MLAYKRGTIVMRECNTVCVRWEYTMGYVIRLATREQLLEVVLVVFRVENIAMDHWMLVDTMAYMSQGETQNQVGAEMPAYELVTFINMRKERTIIIIMWECNTAYVRWGCKAVFNWGQLRVMEMFILRYTVVLNVEVGTIAYMS